MAKYDIYGMGGAIVDIEVEVSDKFLIDSKIEKGIMTLVDESRQTELLEKLRIHGNRMMTLCIT